jgi:hypothetical protein
MSIIWEDRFVMNAKHFSKLTNIIVFIAGLISFLGAEGLKGFIPVEYQYLIPTIVMVAGYILVQLSEDKRVERAENIATNEAFKEVFSPNSNLKGGNSNGYRKL